MENQTSDTTYRTRQLKKYQAWPGNRVGCIFFIEDIPAICLIEGKWRQDDRLGEYDTLHRWERNNIKKEDILLQGLPALLLRKGTLTEEDEDFVQETWKCFIQEAKQFSDIIPDADVLAPLIRESLYWTRRNIEILSFCFGRQAMYYLNQYMSSLLRAELTKIAANRKDLMLRTHAVFQFESKGRNFVGGYSPVRIDMFEVGYDETGKFEPTQLNIPPQDVFAYGFPAAYINYRAAYYAIGQILSNALDMNIISEKILHSFSEYSSIANNSYSNFPHFYITDLISVPHIHQVFLNVPLKDRTQLYDYYLQTLYDDGFYTEGLIDKFFINQLMACRLEESVLNVFDENQLRIIRLHTEEFLGYMLEKFEGNPFYEEAKKIIINMFPSFDEIVCNPMEKHVELLEKKLPKEGDYIELVLWLENQKAQGIDYYAEAGFNRSKMCRNLQPIIKWTKVDQNSLRKAQQSRM